ncbi:tape measure protein [Pedobacter nototheniae]|uniref:tape measure protein n=1 Tax=Pedobacter nototheniae TaxID=2488994 RepID=UPI0010409E79|nr:tape measure protein [Pedobacter nototheniae]
MGVRIVEGGLGFTATIDDSEIDRIASRIESRIENLSKKVQQQGDALDNWAKKAAALAASYASFTEGKELLMNIVKVRGEFQQLEIAFTTMLKSKDEADKLMAQVVKLAATTPFGLQEVANGAKQLLAYGTAAKDITPTISMLGNIASGVSAPLNDIVYLYGTLQTQGRAYSKDIQQFTGRGIPIIKELAAQFKVAESEVMGLVEAGKVGFPEVQKAFQNMTSASGMFYNLMQEQSKSLTGQLSNLEDSFDSMLNAIGKSNEGILNSGIAGLNLLVENYENVITIIGVLVTAYGAYRAALVLEAALIQLVTARTAGLTTQTLLLMGAENLLATATSILNAVIRNSPIIAYTAVITALTVAIYALSQTTSAAAVSQQALADLSASYQGKLAEEKLQLEELVKVAKSRTSTDEERVAAIKKLNELNPEFLKGLNSQNIFTKAGTTAIKEYLKWLEIKLQGEAAYAVKAEAVKRIAERNAKASADPTDKGLNFTTRLGYSLKNFFKGRAMLSAQDEASDIVRQLNQQDQKIIDSVNKQYSEQLKKRVVGNITPETSKPNKAKNKAYYDAIVKENTEALQALDEGAKDFESKAAPLRKKIDEAQKKLRLFEVHDKSADKANDELKKWGEKKLDILNKIHEQEANIYAKGKVQSEKEIEDAHNKYEILRKELLEYNKKAPKSQKLTAGSFTRIDNLEKSETGDIKYRSETEVYKSNLDKQKELYLQFEEYKKKVGLENAKERYKGEINTSQTYLQKLETDLAITLAQAYSAGFTGPIQERLTATSKLVTEEKKRQTEETKNQYAEAYNATLSYEQKVEAIKKQFADQAKILGPQITDSKKAELLRQRDNAINAATDEAYQKTEIYRKLNQEITFLTRQQAKNEITSLNDILKNSNNLPTEYIKSLKEKLKEAESVLDKGTDAGYYDRLKERITYLNKALKEETLVADQAERYRLELKQINLELSTQNKLIKGAQKASSDMAQLSSAFSQMSSSLEGTNDQLAYSLGTLSQIMQVGSDAAGAFASFASGDIIGGITKTIGAVAGLFSIGKKVKEMNAKARAEVQKFYDDALNGEIEYQSLLRERERNTASAQAKRLSGLQQEYELLKKQSEEVDKQFKQVLGQLQAMNEGEITGSEYKHGTWVRKAKTTYSYASLAGKDYDQLEQLYTQNRLTDGAKALFEQLRKLKNEGADVTATLAAIAEQTREIFTGTTADSLTDSLLEMFRSGKTGAQELADFFKQTMDEAALSIFKNKILAAAMDQFYDEFAKDAQSDEKLTDTEIADLQKLFTSLTEEARIKFEEFKKITGQDLGGQNSSNNTVSGIQGMSQQTAELIAGQFGGLRIAQLESNTYLKAIGASNTQLMNMASDRLAVLNKIEANTFRTATNTDRLANIENSLVSMDKKMGNNANAERAAGGI